MAFRYNHSNVPTQYPTNAHAPCKVCSGDGACTSNFDRTVYVCKSVASDNPMPHLNGWVHVLERPCGDPGMWTSFLEPCIRFSDPELSVRLAGALGIGVGDLARYPFAIDPVHHHGVLPAVAADGTPQGVYLFRNSGPQPGAKFMLRYSSASPSFPIRPASGGRLYCMSSITDALQGQAAGFDTAFNGSQFISATGTKHLACYAKACNVTDVVLVADSKSSPDQLKHLSDAGEYLHRVSGGCTVFLAQVPKEVRDFRSWIATKSFSPSSGLPDEILIAIN